jgi:hypothetical protein
MKIPRALAVQRERNVWEMRLRGYSYDEISEKLSINPATIATILKRLTKRYRDQHLKEIEIIKDEQIAQHEMIYREAMESWHKSKGAAITTRKKAYGTQKAGINGGVEQIHESKDQHGDPRYLGEAMKAKEHIRKIVGADAPTRSESKIKLDSDLEAMTDDELIQLATQTAEPRTAGNAQSNSPSEEEAP